MKRRFAVLVLALAELLSFGLYSSRMGFYVDDRAFLRLTTGRRDLSGRVWSKDLAPESGKDSFIYRHASDSMQRLEIDDAR